MSVDDVGYADQQAAATRAAIGQVRALRDRMDAYGCDFRERAPVPAWLAAAVKRHEDIVAAGGGFGCAHVARSRGPMATHVALWTPGTVSCGPCAEVGGLFASLPETLSCTACGAGEPPPEFFGALSLGPFVVEFLLCEGCRADAVAWSTRHGNPVAGGAGGPSHTTEG